MSLITETHQPRRWQLAALVVVAHAALGAALMHVGKIEISLAANPVTVMLIPDRPATSPPPPKPAAPQLPTATVTNMAAPEVAVVTLTESPNAISVATVASAPASQAPVTDMQPVQVTESELNYLAVPEIRRPAASRRSGEHGTVVLLLHIDETGRVSQVLVQRSSSYQRLDEAAVKAMWSARFQPVSRNGRSCAAMALVPVEFPA